MEEICSQSLERLKAWMEKMDEKAFRAKQIFEWIYQRSVSSFDEMTNLSLELREKLKQTFSFSSLKKIQSIVSKDRETIKFLWELPDRKRVESVLIFSGERRTLCVSCQIGCPVRCAFCASGKKGLFRNLSAAQIVEQLLFVNRFLADREERVTHIVFMGMGEPLENYESVVRAIEIFLAEEGFHLSQRRITISTVGIIENIQRLAEEDFKVNLVLSLHAPNQNIRKKIIPYARKYPLEEMLFAMDRYAEKTKRDITYEYILIENLNDLPSHAQELSTLLSGKRCTLNLIPYNPVEGLLLKRPRTNRIEAFRKVLEKARINTTQRYTKGDDIAAACGQLACL